LAALRKGQNTTGEITQTIYTNVSAALQRVAEFSVLAHLEKLVREGRVKKEGDRYLPLNDH
jgi:fatty acid-binding protein DegV